MYQTLAELKIIVDRNEKNYLASLHRHDSQDGINRWYEQYQKSHARYEAIRQARTRGK